MKLIDTVIHLARTVGCIESSPLPREQKEKIRSSFLKTFFFSRYKRKEKLADIAGFSVSFSSYQTLDTLFAEIFINQEYYFCAGKPDPVIIDCGSNIGMALLYFKFLYPAARITSFEPDRSTFSILQKNIENNQLRDIQCHNAAVMGKEGTIDFYFDRENPASLTMSTQMQRMPKDRNTVSAVVLSNYIDSEIDCLKLDVEGAEGEVLEELSETSKIKKIRYMMIEYHHHIDRLQDQFGGFLALLEKNGFGYQLEAGTKRRHEGPLYQDFLIHAYNKKALPNRSRCR